MLAELLRASRPYSWINTALPCLACGIAVDRHAGALLVLATIYFLVPYNLLVYGVNDLYDYESDRRNPRKGGAIEGGVLPPARAGRLWGSVVLTNLPFLAVLAPLGGPAVAVTLALIVLDAVAYSAPPLRTKVIPGLDSVTSSLHFVLPAVCGGLVAGSNVADLPWVVLVAFFLWGVASQSLGAIQDVRYDREAGIGSVAVALGARRTALLSTGAYACAVALVASRGGPGIAAAIALLPYPLLAASCLGPDWERQARRAWRSFLGLNLLCGFLVTQVLLHVWGVDAVPVPHLLAGGSAIGACLCLGLLLLNHRSMRRTGAMTPSARRVSVIVPARNEARSIEACVGSLLEQRHPDLEVIVVDDSSDDGTADIARRVLADRGRVLTAGDVPPGWTGKCWAASTGASAAGGDTLLFVDADTTLAPHAVPALCAELDVQGGGLVSGLTRYRMATGGERLLIPAFAVVQTALVPVVVLNRLRGSVAALTFAYGPCIMVDRIAYERSGGHAAIRGSERDDVDIARGVARTGAPVRFVSASDLGETRHYRRAAEVAACWRRTYYAYGGHSLAVALVGAMGTAIVELLPLAMLLVGLAGHDPVTVAAAATGCAALALTRLLIARWERQSLLSIAWHPVTWVATLAFQVMAITDGLRGRAPLWRGRRLIGAAA